MNILEMNHIKKKFDEKTVLKIFNGYKKLVSVRKPRSMNENFLKFREIVKEKNIFDYEVVFVSFSNGFSQQALDAFESESEDIRDTTGNDIQHSLILQKNICENINIKIFAFFIDLILKSCYTATSGYLKMLILRHMLCDSYVFT